MTNLDDIKDMLWLFSTHEQHPSQLDEAYAALKCDGDVVIDGLIWVLGQNDVNLKLLALQLLQEHYADANRAMTAVRASISDDKERLVRVTAINTAHAFDTMNSHRSLNVAIFAKALLMFMSRRYFVRTLLSHAICLLIALPAAATNKPVKVFILVGQSNMESHAKVETFDDIGDDPKTVPLLKKMRNADGAPRICDGAWISYFTGRGEKNGEGHGKLTAGYGSRPNPSEDGGKIGPEFTFGIKMDETFNEPVLIIKTAWGGKSTGNSLIRWFASKSATPQAWWFFSRK